MNIKTALCLLLTAIVLITGGGCSIRCPMTAQKVDPIRNGVPALALFMAAKSTDPVAIDIGNTADNRTFDRKVRRSVPEKPLRLIE